MNASPEPPMPASSGSNAPEVDTRPAAPETVDPQVSPPEISTGSQLPSPSTTGPQQASPPISRKTLDEQDLMMLDPSWLEKFPEGLRQEMFFRSVLPILTLKIDQYSDEEQPPLPNPLVLPVYDWVSMFSSPIFDVTKAMEEFNKDRLKHATYLARFLNLEWARLMHQKLWIKCGECFLLGLAYSSWQNMPGHDRKDLAHFVRNSVLALVENDLEPERSQDAQTRDTRPADLPSGYVDLGNIPPESLLSNNHLLENVSSDYPSTGEVHPAIVHPPNHPLDGSHDSLLEDVHTSLPGAQTASAYNHAPLEDAPRTLEGARVASPTEETSQQDAPSKRNRSKEVPSDRVCHFRAGNFLCPAEQRFLEACRQEILNEIENRHDFDLSAEDIMAGGNWSPEHQTVTEMVKNLSKFAAMKRSYQNRHPEVLSQSCDFDRWIQIIQLGCWDGSEFSWKGYDIKKEIWNVYQEGLFDATIGDAACTPATQWLILSTNIRSFCLQAGATNLGTDPFRNVDRLRDYIAAEMIYTQELYRTIDKLQKELFEKNKIILSLSMRHILEQLPGPGTPGHGGKDKWKHVWRAAWKNGKKAVNSRDLTHPFYELLMQHDRQRKGIYKCGLRLYGTLSANIHKYCLDNKDTLLRSIPLDEDQKCIFKALTPNDGFNEYTDWKNERKKLGIKSELEEEEGPQASSSNTRSDGIDAEPDSDEDDDDSDAASTTSAVSFNQSTANHNEDDLESFGGPRDDRLDSFGTRTSDRYVGKALIDFQKPNWETEDW
ncbi:hypothetical protein EG329_007400 [Mollisiaceae sp. DMI_Dod_QoI]|nr:hypothetical protein EG329_007400 [Helotiales sp. DMI_Dod_QoI]